MPHKSTNNILHIHEESSVNILHVHTDSSSSVLPIDPSSNRLLTGSAKGIIGPGIVSYNTNAYLSRHEDFQGVSLSGRWSRMSTEDVNILMTNLIGHEIRGPAILALRRGGKIIDFDKNLLDKICNIVIENRAQQHLL